MKKYTMEMEREASQDLKSLSNEIRNIINNTDPLKIFKISADNYTMILAGDTMENLTLEDIADFFAE